MSSLDQYVGKVLDGKYRLERLLGQGGMGAVYLATHLGTERYVALKLIAPQFMRNDEFVQRFKREARAAGRLRHPNVVDVTDFGFAHADEEPVAYLVMEYLDGCTLADVLKEEQRLPAEWVVDILEQVCSAVHEAHQQGIVHRDLKPENIWLEPNRLGSYRVKVLDFGIAKLAAAEAPVEESSQTKPEGDQPFASPTPPLNSSGLEVDTLLYSGDSRQPGTEPESTVTTATLNSKEAEATQLLASLKRNDATPTAVFSRPASNPDEDRKTLRFEQSTLRTGLVAQGTSVPKSTQGTELTRVGAIMGTPLYMSPEQCVAKSLDLRSDIYSLGVIAYQMLAGEPPFTGDTAAVMRGHLESPVPPLRERSKKIPKRVAQVVMSALAKDPADRPQTAAAFANSLRAQAESIGSLYRRAVALYSEYFPKFIRLSFIAHIPVIVTTFALIGLRIAEHSQPRGFGVARVSLVVLIVIFALLHVVGYFVAAAAISGMTAVIVTQLSVTPLRPVELRAAFAVLKRRWRPFLKTAILVTLRIIVGFALLVIPGIIMSIRYALYAPVVLLEGLEKKAALRRARELASRSWRTVAIVLLLQLLIPALVGALLGRISLGGARVQVGSSRPARSLEDEIYQQLLGLINIFVVPLMSIVPALLYLRMRQLGGETLTEVMEQIRQADDQTSEWQQRMRTRLTSSTARSSRQTTDAGDSGGVQ
jgi:serine/threonine protein kinase